MFPVLLMATTLHFAPGFPPDQPGKPVQAQILGDYFVKNTTPIPATGLLTRVVKTQEAFDEMVQQVPPLGLRRPGGPDQKLTTPLPADAFPGHVVLAVATRAHASAEYSSIRVTRVDDTLTLQFKSSVPEGKRLGKVDPLSSAAVFVSPLLVLVPAKAMEGVKSVEFAQDGTTPVVQKP
jgi:hypothetical protein